MYSIFVSKVAKLLGLNPYENPQFYEQMFIKREFRLPAVLHEYFKPAIDLPKIKYNTYKLKNSTMPHKLKFDGDQCNFGIQSERKVINFLKDKYEINGFQTAVKYQLNDKYQIFGKVDGIFDDNIVEIKCRTTSFRGIMPFELPQVQLYMLCSGLRTTIFIEAYGNKLKAYLIKFDQSYIDVLLGEINKLVRHFENYRIEATTN